MTAPRVLLVAALLTGVVLQPADAAEGCGYPYPDFSRFVVLDDGAAFCSEYLRLGGERVLGLPISRPFRIGNELYQAFEYAVLWWQADEAQATLVDVMDVLHAAGRDRMLERLGVPPGREPSLDWLTDDTLRAVYGRDAQGHFGLPTSPPTPIGPYVAQRFQRTVVRRWVQPVPYDIAGAVGRAADGSRIERMMVGDLLRSSGLIPGAALIAEPGHDPNRYNVAAVPTELESFWTTPPRAIGGWEPLLHRVGAFNIGVAGHDVAEMRGEVSDAFDLGLSLAVNSYVGRDSSAVKAALDRDMGLIDTYPWDRIAAACRGHFVDRGCRFGTAELQRLEGEVRHHFVLTRLDDSVVAYWVLDDDPGDVRPALELIHRLVQEESWLDRQARPTVCGFGGDLDESGRATATAAASRSTFETALNNFSPTACDAVALYPYRGARAWTVDWSMRDLLPYMLGRLRERGWEPARQPLIGIPQAFAFGDTPAPRAADLADQAAAYCAAGASSIVYYAWNDTYTGPKVQLANSADLRQGAADGLARCQTIWSR